MEPQYGESNSTVLVLIQIEDANDNRPQFNSQSYSGSIRADAAEGELVTIENGGYISVSDIDQAVSILCATQVLWLYRRFKILISYHGIMFSYWTLDTTVILYNNNINYKFISVNNVK